MHQEMVQGHTGERAPRQTVDQSYLFYVNNRSCLVIVVVQNAALLSEWSHGGSGSHLREASLCRRILRMSSVLLPANIGPGAQRQRWSGLVWNMAASSLRVKPWTLAASSSSHFKQAWCVLKRARTTMVASGGRGLQERERTDDHLDPPFIPQQL